MKYYVRRSDNHSRILYKFRLDSDEPNCLQTTCSKAAGNVPVAVCGVCGYRGGMPLNGISEIFGVCIIYTRLLVVKIEFNNRTQTEECGMDTIVIHRLIAML